MGSILNDVKKMSALPPENTDFDQELILFINTAFATLSQLGVVSSEGYSIQDEKSEWEDVIPNDVYNDVKTYVYLRVRMLFDPPTVGVLSNSFEEQIKELEWRLNVKREEDVWIAQPRLF